MADIASYSSRIHTPMQDLVAPRKGTEDFKTESIVEETKSLNFLSIMLKKKLKPRWQMQ